MKLRDDLKLVFNLNRWRLSRGLTHADAASLTGVTEAAWRYIEKGFAPNLRTGLKVAAAVGKRVDDIWVLKRGAK